MIATDTLKTDLDRRIHDKLTVWIRDSFALYEMADLPQDTAGGVILTNLLDAAGLLADVGGIPPAEIAKSAFLLALAARAHGAGQQQRLFHELGGCHRLEEQTVDPAFDRLAHEGRALVLADDQGGGPAVFVLDLLE